MFLAANRKDEGIYYTPAGITGPMADSLVESLAGRCRREFAETSAAKNATSSEPTLDGATRRNPRRRHRLRQRRFPHQSPARCLATIPAHRSGHRVGQ